MSESENWRIPPSLRPRPSAFSYDVGRAVSSVVSVRTETPDDAFTASVLGTERQGNGVVVDPRGLVLTIGYLVVEAEKIWLRANNGRAVPGFTVGYDPDSGFGLIQALEPLDLPALPLGRSSLVSGGDMLVVAGFGGLQRSLNADVVAKREFAGYWEYLLDEALFTAPAHPAWGGAATIAEDGTLVGIGSLRIEREGTGARAGSNDLNMIVPIDLLKPIYADLKEVGRPRRPPRPWFGLYTVEQDDRLAVVGMAENGPAANGGIEVGDAIAAVNGTPVATLAAFYRQIWASGNAGTEINFSLWREEKPMTLRMKSASRWDFLKSPRLH